MADPESFEKKWPEIAEALNRMLARKDVSKSDRDDIVQETAARLIRLWGSVDHSRPIMPFAITIALNILRDSARRRTKREITLGDLPDRPGPSDVEREGLDRLDLHRVVHALGRLSPSQRDALLVEVSDSAVPPGRGPDALKMLRLRARRKLTSILEGASAAVGLLALRLRSTSDDVTHSAAGALAAVALVATLPAPSAAVIDSTGSRFSLNGVHLILPSDHRVATHQPRLKPGEPSRVNATTVGRAQRPGVRVDNEGRPVRIPIGDKGYAEASGSISVDEKRVEVRDHGGPVPACLGGIPGTPTDLECPD